MTLVLSLVGIHQNLRETLGGSIEEVRSAIREIGIFEEGGGGEPGNLEEGSILACLEIQQSRLALLRAEKSAPAKRFEVIFEQAPIGIAIIDSDSGRFLKTNSKFGEIVGYRPGELEKLTWMEITHPDDIRRDEEQTRSLNAGEVPSFSMEKRYFHRNGSVVWIQLTIAPLRLPGAREKTHLSMISDITERKRRESELHDALERARAAAVAKDNFLAGISHEIRTPLNGILGMTEMLLESEISAEWREFVHVARACAETLLALVNDLLDFSRIEGGDFRIERVDFDLFELIESCAKPHRFDASKKGLLFSVETGRGLPRRVLGDPSRLRQILYHLLSNAVKFTEKGGVTFRAVPAAKPGVIDFEISDTGIGISPQNIPLLFQKFTQLDASATRRHGGAGLGLCLSRQVAQKMGGDISVSSKPGAGSRFVLSLPLDDAQHKPAPEPDSKPATEGAAAAAPAWKEGARVLVVEDNPNNRLLLMRHLKVLGLPAHAVENGMEAIGELINNRYAIVLMDLQMPVMGGLDATTQIRAGAAGPENSEIPIVAVTANAQPEERTRCLAAGMNDYLLKPFTRAQLLEKIRPHLCHQS